MKKNILTMLLVVWGSLLVISPSYAKNSDNIFPTLSLKSQEFRTQQKIIQKQALVQNSQLLKQAEKLIVRNVPQNQLQDLRSLKKLYILNDFKPVWRNSALVKLFIQDYIIFAASGISHRALNTLDQILVSKKGSVKRDILLSDAFLDYYYYNRNLKENINQWLYAPFSYHLSTINIRDLIFWVDAIKHNKGVSFIKKFIPTENSIYLATADKILSGTLSPKNIQKLALNAQRLRAIPDFKNGLYVNIPTYQLDYFKDGQLVLHSVVVVGKKKRPTPVLFSTLSDVVVNPPWTVPPTILEKDVIPKYTKIVDYGAKKGFTILNYAGKEVEPSTIDWTKYQGENAKKFPYMVRQKAGKTAALGRYKFNMPSKDAIFLHDTPHKGVFKRRKRALSSGCIRVQKASELGKMLLTEAGWSQAKHSQVYNSEETVYVKIRSENPVYLYYVTSWIENDKLNFVSDVYDLDPIFKAKNINWMLVKTAFFE